MMFTHYTIALFGSLTIKLYFSWVGTNRIFQLELHQGDESFYHKKSRRRPINKKVNANQAMETLNENDKQEENWKYLQINWIDSWTWCVVLKLFDITVFYQHGYIASGKKHRT